MSLPTSESFPFDPYLNVRGLLQTHYGLEHGEEIYELLSALPVARPGRVRPRRSCSGRTGASSLAWSLRGRRLYTPMKSFHDFLQEMALKSYRTDFHHATKEGEGFFTDKDGRKNVGIQVRKIDPVTSADIRSRFSEKDRAVITHPRTARTLESRLARSGYDFNILFIEDIRGTAGRYRRQVESFIKKNGIQKEGHITFVKSGTSGHVMTPWMVLHTIGHAVAGEASRHDTYDKIGGASRKIMSHVSDSECTLDMIKVGSECQKALAKVLAFASVSATKSNTAGNNQEFAHEIIAEYLWNGGSIRVKAPYDNENEVMSQIGIMEDEVRGMLDRCVGKVVYNYYDVSLFGPSFG